MTSCVRTTWPGWLTCWRSWNSSCHGCSLLVEVVRLLTVFKYKQALTRYDVQKRVRAARRSVSYQRSSASAEKRSGRVAQVRE